MSRILRGEEASEIFDGLLELVDAEGPILVQREDNKPAILVVSLGQPGRAATIDRLEELLEILQGQPGNAAAQGQPGRAAAEGGSDRAAIVRQLEELVEALRAGQPGRA